MRYLAIFAALGLAGCSIGTQMLGASSYKGQPLSAVVAKLGPPQEEQKRLRDKKRIHGVRDRPYCDAQSESLWLATSSRLTTHQVMLIFALRMLASHGQALEAGENCLAPPASHRMPPCNDPAMRRRRCRRQAANAIASVEPTLIVQRVLTRPNEGSAL